MTTTAPISDAARLHLRWSLVDGIGPILFSRLLVRFGDAQTALGASARELLDVQGIGRDSADRIARDRTTVDIEREVEACTQLGLRIICREDADFPEGLRQIPDAPIVLY